MFASVLRVTGDKESDWTIAYQPVVGRFEQGKAEMWKVNMMDLAPLLYARAFHPDGAGNFGKDSRLHHEKLGLEKEDLDGAT
ncbi:hypothetical protein Vi05172_g6794 [Venturia inaequalis]|nr:hypothetical protein Vi05172_g6794 [Venturia inaequalis]